jgi:hypothetical protein
MKSEIIRGIGLTSPMGRSRRAAPGEGLFSIDRPYPLSPWERGHTAVVATLMIGSGTGGQR